MKRVCLLLLAFTVAAFGEEYTVYTGKATPDAAWRVFTYFPTNITIVEGDTIKFVMGDATEPHTVTFANNGTELYADPITGEFGPAILPYGGNVVNQTTANGVVSSGLLITGFLEEWTAEFPEAGTYTYFCLLHPFQVGFVNVLPSTETAPFTPEEVEEAAEEERDASIANVEQLAIDNNLTRTEPDCEDNGDGSKTCTIVAEWGDFGAKIAYFRFIPASVTVNFGDSLKWVVKGFSPHTATWNETSDDLPPPMIFKDDKVFHNTFYSVPTGTTYTGGVGNTGMFGLEEFGMLEYTMKMEKAGTFNYICGLHSISGMTGTIEVLPAPTTGEPGTSTSGSTTGTAEDSAAASVTSSVVMTLLFAILFMML